MQSTDPLGGMGRIPLHRRDRKEEDRLPQAGSFDMKGARRSHPQGTRCAAPGNRLVPWFSVATFGAPLQRGVVLPVARPCVPHDPHSAGYSDRRPSAQDPSPWRGLALSFTLVGC